MEEKEAKKKSKNRGYLKKSKKLLYKNKLQTKHSMKTRIHLHFALVGAIAILLTVLFSMLVFYNLFRGQVFQDLENYSALLQGSNYLKIVNELAGHLKEDKQRVTIISSDGTILFESNAKLEEMDNHKDRPEIKDAFHTGEGKSVRHSQTLGRSTYYYAKLLSDGNIIRVALETNDAMTIFYKILPVFLLMIGTIFCICFLMAKYLTRWIVKPIEQMAENIEDIEEKAIYEELVPFAKIIKEQHADIKRQMLDLEKSSQVRQDFTANVSHELKTPLTIISGYAELMEQGMAKSEDVVHFSGEIHRNATRLLTLINDIIQLAELDGEEMEIEKKEFDLYELAKRCVEEMKVKAKKHKVSIEMDGKPKTCMVYASADMIEEMLTNLCDNAIRYNKPQGSVLVSVKWIKQEIPAKELERCVFLSSESIIKEKIYSEAREENQKENEEEKKIEKKEEKRKKKKGRVCLMVSDTGIGIPRTHQERIFERFYRVDKSRSKATGGTGLGLAIVKHIAAKNQADILLYSAENQGTEIKILF